MALLRSAMPSPPDLSGAIAVACGGNAEALAALAAGPRMKGIPAINLRLLRERIDGKTGDFPPPSEQLPPPGQR